MSSTVWLFGWRKGLRKTDQIPSHSAGAIRGTGLVETDILVFVESDVRCRIGLSLESLQVHAVTA